MTRMKKKMQHLMKKLNRNNLRKQGLKRKELRGCVINKLKCLNKYKRRKMKLSKKNKKNKEKKRLGKLKRGNKPLPIIKKYLRSLQKIWKEVN